MERSASGMKARIITGQSVRGFLTRNLVVLFTVAAIAAGVILGLALRPLQLTAPQIAYLSYPGELLMRMLQMVMLPLVVSSLVTGVASLDGKASGRMARRAAAYYAVTTTLAVLLGVAMVTIIKPGKVGGGGGGGSPAHPEEVSGGGTLEPVRAADAMLDLIRNMVPPNLVEACFRSHRTAYRKVNVTVEEELVPVAASSPGVNVLGLVAFSLCFGLAVGHMGERGDALRGFFAGLNEAVTLMVAGVVRYSPVGILFLIAGKMAEMGDAAALGGRVAMYTLTVTAGLLLHGLLVLPLLFLLATGGRNPYAFMAGLVQALLTALGTSSSSATLPVTLRCAEENCGVDRRVTRLVLPVGATVNMDGDALYEAVAALFIAQAYGVDLGLGRTVVVSVTATLASVGAAGIPQGGLVTMAMVLASVGLPMEGVTLILVVDWFVDRVRTAVNVLGDCLGAGIVEHLSRAELQRGDPEPQGGPAHSGDAEPGGPAHSGDAELQGDLPVQIEESGDAILQVAEGD